MQLALTPATIELWVLAFARVGAMAMTLPTLGERALPARMRLSLALAIAFAAMPGVEALEGKGPVLAVLAGEVLLGLAIGICGRLVIAAMEIAGNLIALSIGLSFAQSIDPSQGQQGEVLTTFFRMAGVALLLAADAHHLLIGGIVGSYQSLPVGTVLQPGDLLALLVRLLGVVFATGVAIAAPFVAFGFLFNIGLGFASRLTPQMQLFFLAMPLSVLIGAGGLAIAMPMISQRFIELSTSIFAMLFPV